MPRILSAFTCVVALTLTPLAGHAAVFVIDAPTEPLSIGGDDIARVVDGGALDFLTARDQSVVEMSGGLVSAYIFADDARATLAGGEIGTVALSERAQADFNGSFHGTSITLTGESRADVRGGFFLRGGFLLSDAATLHVYGSGFQWASGGLRGFLEDGTPFNMFNDRSIARTDDPNALYRQLMPEGLCVHTGGNEYCGPTLFYSAPTTIALNGNERMTLVDGGSAGFVQLNETASLEMRGGAATVGMGDHSHAVVRAGAGAFIVGGEARLTLQGGNVGNIELREAGVAEVVAQTAAFTSGSLHGTWADGATFETRVTDSGALGPLMPAGLCVTLGGVTHCGSTVFYQQDSLDLFGEQAATIVDGAAVTSLHLNQASHATVRGGTVGLLSAFDDAKADVAGGQINEVSVGRNAMVDISGGTVQRVAMEGRGVAILSDVEGLSFLDLGLLDGGQVILHVLAGRYAVGQISGSWLNGTTFNISVIGADPNVLPTSLAIIAVPEPATWLMMVLGLGGLMLPRPWAIRRPRATA